MREQALNTDFGLSPSCRVRKVSKLLASSDTESVPGLLGELVSRYRRQGSRRILHLYSSLVHERVFEVFPREMLPCKPYRMRL